MIPRLHPSSPKRCHSVALKCYYFEQPQNTLWACVRCTEKKNEEMIKEKIWGVPILQDPEDSYGIKLRISDISSS